MQSSWDEYQNELVRKFYGGEPKAKKPLPVYNAPANSIIVPGLAGDVLLHAASTPVARLTYSGPPDAHAHILQYGFKMQLPLDKARTLSGLLDILEDYVHSHPPGPDTWIEAIGWDQTRWSDTDGAFPTAVRFFAAAP